MSFYDKFNDLCVKKGVTPTKAARDNGIAQSVISMWKKRGSTPKIQTIQKLSDYFGVPMDVFFSKPLLLDSVFDSALNQLFEDVHNEFPNDKEINHALAEVQQLHKDSVEKEKLNEAFGKLNREGRQKAIERVQELTEISRYRRSDAPSPPPESDTPTDGQLTEKSSEDGQSVFLNFDSGDRLA